MTEMEMGIKVCPNLNMGVNIKQLKVIQKVY